MEPITSSPVLVDFALPVLINLPQRIDRFRATMRELERACGRPIYPGQDLEVLRPPRFDDPAGFPSPARRSRLSAHLEVAELGAARGADAVLVLEDDVEFSPDWIHHQAGLLDTLGSADWDVATLGWSGPTAVTPDGGFGIWARNPGPVSGSHAYLLHHQFLPTWIDHLHSVATGRDDDVEVGVDPDEALNAMFRRDPSLVRLVAAPSLVGQRPSRSDLDTHWGDRTPVARSVLGVIRRTRIRARRLRR